MLSYFAFFGLASALFALAIRWRIGLALLILACLCALFAKILSVKSLAFIVVMVGVIVLHYLKKWKWLEWVVVLASVMVYFHFVPDFSNPKILDAVFVSPQSTAYTMYFNFDKALIPFMLLGVYPVLFVSASVPKRRPLYLWVILAVCMFALLGVATLLGALKVEFHIPSWIGLFVIINLFFVSLAEEALFRGYLQQRCGEMIGKIPALFLCAFLFGLTHYKGGLLLVIFASLAGIFYGVAWLWSGRLWASTLFHFSFNLVHLLCFTYPLKA